MIEFFIKRPVTTIMFILFFVVLGIFSFFNLKFEKQPKIDFPLATVSVVYPGATPIEIETSIINKIENAVSEISEVKKIRSHSYDNFGYVFVEFLISSDINNKVNELKDKVGIISFYSVADNPDIEISCSDTTRYSTEKDTIIPGEGGTKGSIQTGKYTVITSGIILLYGDKRNIECDWPIVELHELLHAFGFDHSPDKNSLMFQYHI